MKKSTEVTRDVWPAEFPPAVYGHSLAEIEATVQEAVECVFRDDDGILRSSVNGRTAKPYSVEDVRDRPEGVGTFTEHSDIPTAAKPLWMNYENTGQSSGVYLEALCAKASVTGDAEPRELAARLFEAIVTLWDNAATIAHPNGGGGRGWFPKPYLGIQNVEGMHECSADQYVDITLGLHAYYLTFASEEERRKIEAIVTSFAEWWYDHDYCGVYLGKAIWWKRLTNHALAAGCFLYLNALAYSWDPCRKFQRGFEVWLENKHALVPSCDPIWVCDNGIALKCIGRLIDLRPDMKPYWMRAAAKQAGQLVKSLEHPTGLNRKYGIETFAANYLSTAHRLMPDSGYDRHIRRCLQECTTRSHYYHLVRGMSLSEYESRELGDDFVDALQCECHVHWLAAYWASPYLHPKI